MTKPFEELTDDEAKNRAKDGTRGAKPVEEDRSHHTVDATVANNVATATVTIVQK